MISKSVLLVVAIIAGTALSASLPAYIKKCKRDKDLDKCAIASANAAISKFAKGDAKLKIPSTDPFRVDELKVDESEGAVAAKIKFNDISIRGLGDSKMVHSKIDLKKKVIEWTVESPKAVMDAMYEINGRVLVLPITGKGKCLIELEKLKVAFVLTYKLKMQKGKEVLEIENVDAKHFVDKMTLRLDNLFNGNKALGDNMNLVLNDNWQELNNQLGPAIVQSIAIGVKNSLNRFFSQIPFSEILTN